MRSPSIQAVLFLILLIGLAVGSIPAAASPLPQTADTETPDPTLAPTSTATATVPPVRTQKPEINTVVPTNTQESIGSSDRALVIIKSYSADTDKLRPGKDFKAKISLVNTGQNPAVNIALSFTPGDLIPRDTGGTVSMQQLNPLNYRRHPDESEGSKSVTQPLTVSPAVALGAVANCTVTISYTDMTTGEAYSGTFSIAFHISDQPAYTGPALPTVTPTAVLRPQLVVSSYNTDVVSLQPGGQFKLTLEVRNLGNTAANNVTMVVGGGSAGNSGASGTQEPGGVSGTGGDFSNFAPLKSSNIQFIGDIPTGQAVHAEQALIVNVSTNPGAYSLKLSFLYSDARGAHYTDDQVITLLVFSPPLVEVNFYREAGPFYVGQPGPLPVQIINLGRKATVLGTMKLTTKSGQIMNDSTLVGALDAGLSFPLDSNLIADKTGPVDIDVTISFIDDFNQPQTLNQTLSVNVQDAPIIEEPLGPDGKPINSGEGSIPTPAPETFWDKVTRFLKGMIGLDSGVPQPAQLNPGMEGTPAPGESQPGVSGGKPIIAPAPPMKMP